jgi:hypothetical protein
LDSAAVVQQGIGQPGVVHRTARAALFPRLEGLLRFIPGRQRSTILVCQSHSSRIVDPDRHIRPGLARRVDGLLGQVHGAVHVGVCAGLLAPKRRRQHDVGQLGGFGAVAVGDHDETLIARKNPPDAGEVGIDTAGLVPAIQRNPIEPCSA